MNVQCVKRPMASVHGAHAGGWGKSSGIRSAVNPAYSAVTINLRTKRIQPGVGVFYTFSPIQRNRAKSVGIFYTFGLALSALTSQPIEKKHFNPVGTDLACDGSKENFPLLN